MKNAKAPAEIPTEPLRPRWIAQRGGQQVRELWLGKRLVKHFPTPAKLQECVLAAFQKRGWPPWIADPLPTDGTTQRPQARLRDVARTLNNHQKDAHICFFCDGTGEHICWRLKPRPKRKDPRRKGSRRDR
jgi:hypothetical protein